MKEVKYKRWQQQTAWSLDLKCLPHDTESKRLFLSLTKILSVLEINYPEKISQIQHYLQRISKFLLKLERGFWLTSPVPIWFTNKSFSTRNYITFASRKLSMNLTGCLWISFQLFISCYPSNSFRFLLKDRMMNPHIFLVTLRNRDWLTSSYLRHHFLTRKQRLIYLIR